MRTAFSGSGIGSGACGSSRSSSPTCEGRVADGIGGQFRVRDKEARVVGSADRRVRETDLLYHARGSTNFDLVAEANRLGERDQETGDEIGQGGLGSKTDDEGNDGRRGENRPRDGPDRRNDEEGGQEPDRQDG